MRPVAAYGKVHSMLRRFGTLLVAFAGLVSVQAQEGKRSVWSGAYTESQAERGLKAFTANCAECHQADLGGKGEVPALKGDTFMERWHDYTTKPLFNMIKTEMPPLRFRTAETKPLADETYVDIISYIFKANGFPAGDRELAAGNLDQIQILGKNGVQPAPQFALVVSVGCLRYKPISWMLSYATTPVRATMPDIATREEVAEAKSALLGLREYRLADFGYLGKDFNPEAFEEHRVLVKGYIIRQPEFERISVTSVTDIAAQCE
jgi:mono/diheme cytochrome c family protein